MKTLISHLIFIGIIAAIASRIEGLVNIACVVILVCAILNLLYLAILLVYSASDSAESTKAITEMADGINSDFLVIPKRIAMVLVLSYFGMFFICGIYVVGIFFLAIAKAGVKKELLQRGVQS